MTIPLPPPPPPPPPRGAPADDALAERLARLQQRRPAPVPPPSGTSAPVPPPNRRRRRHPAAGARAGAVALTLMCTGGLGALLASLDGGPSANAVLSALPAPITTPSNGSPPRSTTRSTTSDTTSATADSTVQPFNGPLIATRYGPVQVQAQIARGTIVDIAVVAYPDGDGRSRSINGRALPELRSEVLTAQSANVDTVSGATYTSDGYRRSLQAALDQARADRVIST